MALMMPDVELSAVSFQTRRLGWNTDDLLLVGTNRSGQQRRTALQVKLTFYLRPSDDECVETVCGMWRDFSNSILFDQNLDRLGIVVGQTTHKTSRGTRLLVDIARACGDEADFFHRLGLPKYVGSDARECLGILREILLSHFAEAVTDESVWRFLRVVELAVLDFESPSSVAEGLVKSLLAATCNGPAAGAQETWNALLALSGEAAPASRDIGWSDLPLELRERHRASSSNERETLEALNTSTQVIVDSADSKIGGRLSLARREVVSAILDALSENDAVVITGEAGSGKSVVSGKVFQAVSGSGMNLAFRAETLAEPHVAASLRSLGISLREVVRLFALHPRKVLWVESAERLLEKDAGQREAFSDLLRIFVRAGGWRLLITCRDYNVETFRTAFLERTGVRSEIVPVPQLSDEELSEVRGHLPELTLPLKAPALLKIVRNPFYLSLAASMKWSPEIPLPTSVRAFREKAWKDVVCREDEVVDGMPLERDRTMVEIALRRARALTPYVKADGLHASALQRLQRDSLIAGDPDDHAQFAPAHDVYEDWALLRWLQRVYNEERALGTGLFSRIETHPAMRRTFRRWLTEMLESEPTEADRRLTEILADVHIEQHWKDDALVGVLQSSGAAGFLSRSGRLFHEDMELLRRAVSLLRVACRKLPPGVAEEKKHSSLLLLPEGQAWDEMAVVVAKTLPAVQPADIVWLLRFAEECVMRPKLSNSTETAMGLISTYLLGLVGLIQYRHQRSFQERVLRLMLAVPRAVESQLRTMLDKAFANRDHDWDDHTLPKLVWDHFSGARLCSHFPDMTLRVSERRLGFLPLSDKDEEKARWRSYGRLEVHNVFGFRGGTQMDDFPASAWQGPFSNLLTSHPELGVDLILRLLNRACATYARCDQDIIERPISVSLELGDDIKQEQWANPRLWGMYRGQSVAPHALESALMALEEWLLNKAERGDDDTVSVFSRLLRESNNVAITAALASVAIAYPYFFGSAAVPLLTCELPFRWDFARAFQDRANASGVLDSMFPSIADHMMFEHERRGSAKRKHRWQNLENLCLSLQFTSARNAVWAILDNFREGLPPADQQDDEHLQWRLVLHRMDARNLVVTENTEEGVILQAGNLPAELEEYRERELPAHRERDERLALFTWGMSVFTGNNLNQHSPDSWRENLAAIRSLPPDEEGTPRLLRRSGGPHIAAVCLRDHYDEMAPEELDWCIDTICGEIEAQSDATAFVVGHVTTMDPLAPCVFILPLVVARDTNEARRPRLTHCLTIAILHSSSEVTQFTARGVGRFLLPAKRPLALSCVAAMLSRASELAAHRERQSKLPWDERENQDEFEVALRHRLQAAIKEGLILDENILLSVNYRRYPWLGVLLACLSLFSEEVTDPLTRKFYEKVAALVVLSWRAERRGRRVAVNGDNDEEEDELRYGERHQVHQALARFALIGPDTSAQAVIASLVAAAHEEPKEAAEFLKCLIHSEDQLQTETRFWQHWQAFADAFQAHSMGATADEEYSETAELVSAILLGVEWKSDTHDWKSLRGHGAQVSEFVRKNLAGSRMISAFAGLVNRFASEFLPASLLVLAEMLSSRTSSGLLSNFTLMQLEEALSGLIYSGAVEVRRDPGLRNATMVVLDAMVEAGSSGAFRIRDDFVTPLRSLA